LTFSDAVEKWKSQRAPRDGFSEREMACAGTTRGAPRRLQVNRCKVAARGDTVPCEGRLNAVAIYAGRQADDIDKPTELATWK
jgi:hypothetical protein